MCPVSHGRWRFGLSSLYKPPVREGFLGNSMQNRRFFHPAWACAFCVHIYKYLHHRPIRTKQYTVFTHLLRKLVGWVGAFFFFFFFRMWNGRTLQKAGRAKRGKAALLDPGPLEEGDAPRQTRGALASDSAGVLVSRALAGESRNRARNRLGAGSLGLKERK